MESTALSFARRLIRRVELPPARPSRAPQVFELRFSHYGLVVAILFAAISFLPSLLPRVPLVQGLASGVTFMVGY